MKYWVFAKENPIFLLMEIQVNFLFCCWKLWMTQDTHTDEKYVKKRKKLQRRNIRRENTSIFIIIIIINIIYQWNCHSITSRQHCMLSNITVTFFDWLAKESIKHTHTLYIDLNIGLKKKEKNDHFVFKWKYFHPF